MRDYQEQREAALRRAEGHERRPETRAEDAPTRRGAPLNAANVIGLQRSVGNAGAAAYVNEHEGEDAATHAAHAGATAQRSPVHDTIAGSGSPLDAGTRAAMEQSFGESFGDVRLHVDAHSAESVKAAAYTVGNDIVVHPNHYSPGTPSAQRTLAHELTHVVQQRQGPVDGTDAPGGIRLSDPSDRFEREAEHRADTVMANASQANPGRLSAAGGAERGEDVQRLAVQRQGEEEDEQESTD